jgi:hypothetical protein
MHGETMKLTTVILPGQHKCSDSDQSVTSDDLNPHYQSIHQFTQPIADLNLIFFIWQTQNMYFINQHYLQWKSCDLW